jgi:hypothetical protein
MPALEAGRAARSTPQPPLGDGECRKRYLMVAIPPGYGSSRHPFAGRDLQGGGGWTRRLGRAWARRSAPTTLAVNGSAVNGPMPGHRRRMSARRKQEAVLRLLRGEDLELLSRELSVTAAELSGWRAAFLAAGEASLNSRPADARDAAIGRLKEKVGDLTMANELLEAKIERLETARPLASRRSRR